ncbi:hypothetical protein OC834_006102 [Tilletia horrida]|uniref:Chorismate dehydratase n=1 Tax=Tilletia horrida TaxID=155126 RepID=A0AAN6JKL8_9BASI|nr:hypothetical protein OC834_006102 [Tilletia horrida]KAK0523928.1 hypothetical protein OC835_006094 [Tilletia horrida]KAK0531471.1 hypothetical protein OC842_003613 [Tilletia horrida]KAK0553473.1 hypothetical protein OC844_006287 [Tilletia horrida]
MLATLNAVQHTAPTSLASLPIHTLTPPSLIKRDAPRPRLGQISFLNVLPILLGLCKTGSVLEVDLHRQSPEILNRRLVAGELDISAISLVEYLRNSDKLMLLPGMAVACDGPVLSVHLFSKVPLSELDGKKVALGSTSRTSVLLAQLYLTEKVGVKPEWISCEPNLESGFAEADACVLIGDVALSAMFEAPKRGFSVTDLGEAWRSWTGNSFVFAVWAVRRDYFAAHPRTVQHVARMLLHARDVGIAQSDLAAEIGARWEHFDERTLAIYYRALKFTLGERELAGLCEYARKAALRGEAPARWAEPGARPDFVEL